MLRWLLKVNLASLVCMTAALAVVSTSRLVMGLLFLLAACYYERVEEFGNDFLVSPCLEKFSRTSRRVIERKHRLAVRLVLAAWGILWTARGLSEPWTAAWRLPPGLALTWVGIALVFLTVIELARCVAAGGADTYEQYHARFTPVSRVLGILLVAATFYAMSRYLS